MQLTDSNFPSGAFSHSFGLETFVQHDIVTDATSFQAFIEGYIEQLSYTDGLATKLVYEALEMEDWAKIEEIDQILYCSTAATEPKIGAQRIGQQMLRLYRALYPDTRLDAYASRIQNKTCYGHSSITQAILLYELKIPIDMAIQTVLYSACSTIIQNAVRGIPLGQTDGQKMLQFVIQHCPVCLTKIQTLDEKHLGCTTPLLEVKQMQHEQLHVRLFMS